MSVVVAVELSAPAPLTYVASDTALMHWECDSGRMAREGFRVAALRSSWPQRSGPRSARRGAPRARGGRC